MIKKEELKEKLNNVKGKVVEVGKKIALPAAVIAGFVIGTKFERWNENGTGTGFFIADKESNKDIVFTTYHDRKFGGKRSYIHVIYKPGHPAYEAMDEIYKTYENSTK